MEKKYMIPASILISAIILAGSWIYTKGISSNPPKSGLESESASALSTLTSELEEKVLPAEGIILPARWGDLGVKMTNAGVIDKTKFESLYAQRGGLNAEEKRLLENTDNDQIKMTFDNSGFLLNLFWALGLGTKNKILENGPMNDPRYGDAGNFASTGGWTLAKGNAMDHYSRHPFIVLTAEQQQLVENVSKNIYRPCCNNPVYFPDCNHGMAMLGLLELMASQGVNEQEMYKVALQANAYWFPDTYINIAQYLASKGADWQTADPKELLGANYSSGSGFQQIRSQLAAPKKQSGGGCGVEQETPAAKRSGSGCGL